MLHPVRSKGREGEAGVGHVRITGHVCYVMLCYVECICIERSAKPVRKIMYVNKLAALHHLFAELLLRRLVRSVLVPHFCGGQNRSSGK